MDLRAWLESGKRSASTAADSPSPSKQLKAAEVDGDMGTLKEGEQLLALDEFKDQPLEVRRGDIFCLACKATVGCEPRLLRQLLSETGSLRQG